MIVRPTYRLARIQSVQSLCCALGVTEPQLRSVVSRAPRLYIGPKPKPKKNGKIRYVFDTKAPLKPLLKKINQVLFKRVDFPPYLTGSLSGRDFVANVEIHKGAHIAVSEDIQSFFDSIKAAHVYRIWREFFGFAHEVAELMTALMTKDGAICQGTPTSSYLANLAFWDREPSVVTKLAERGIRYSRYVDDITLSAVEFLNDSDKQWAIDQVYGMIIGTGFEVQRAKHAIATRRGPITIMGLNANSKHKPTLTQAERSNIRALVFQLEQRFSRGEANSKLIDDMNHASGKVGRLTRLHEFEGKQLRQRLNEIRRALDKMSVETLPTDAFRKIGDRGTVASVKLPTAPSPDHTPPQ